MKETSGNKSYALFWVALDKHVLLVQVKSPEGVNHGAYIDAVKGADCDAESLGVAGSGREVSDLLAEVYFKGFGAGPIEPIDTHDPFFQHSDPLSDYHLYPPPILWVNVLERHVMAVAVEAEGDTWKAFIGPVKGADYVVEASEVIKTGTPMSYEAAEVCFEDLAKGMKWHEPLRVCIAGEDYGPAEEWGGEKPAVPVRPGGNSMDDKSK